MRKKPAFILAALMITGTLGGCSNSGSEFSAPTVSGSSGTSISTPYTVPVLPNSSSQVSSSSIPDSGSAPQSSSDNSGEASSASSTSSDSSGSASTSSSSSKQSYSSGTPTPAPSGHGDSAMEVIPKAEQTERVAGDRIVFTAENIFSEGKTYSIKISGVKLANQSANASIDTTFINGVLYGDFRLDLYNSTGSLIDTMKINVPRDDSFLILENAAVGKDYGYTLMSHKESFSDTSYPDLLRLDFFRQRGMAVPQYARYFAVFGDKLDELRFYEKGKEVAPIGTFAEMRGKGLLTQNLTVENGRGGYTVIKYEYRIDLANHRLNRTEVNFTGWGD